MKQKAKKKNKKVDWIRLRLLLVAWGLFLGFVVLIGRSFQIQLLQQESWTTLTKKQIWRKLRFEPLRGEIYDRNGQQLAVSIEMDSLAATPRAVPHAKKTSRQLAALLKTPPRGLEAKLRQKRGFVYLQHYLTPRQVDAVRALDLEGIHFVQENRRYYPNLDLAGHVLGFVGRDHNGLEGLELSQDQLLRGHSDTHPGARDARGQIIYTHGLPADAAPKGYSLKLTLDKRVQHIAERELQATVSTHDAKSGMALVVDPKTGEILAMAAYPAFNPNTFASYSSSAWRNRIVTDAFEPGSTLKIFLAAAVMEEGLVHPNDLFYCEQGEYRVANHTIHDVHEYGWLSLAQILRLSSNIGAAKVGGKLGARRFHHYIRAFGFGAPTGIALPGETAGLVRPAEQWSSLDLATTSFGQSLSVSAIQMAMALGAVANDGLLMQPLLIKQVLGSRDEVIRENKPRALRRVVSKSTARNLKRMLADVVTSEGTGARAALAHYQAAGKTGTAQKSDLKRGGYAADLYTSSFVGFVPLPDPRIVVIVVVNEPKKGHYGGVVAAPAFRRIAEKTLLCLKVPRSQTKSEARSFVKSAIEEASIQGRLTTPQPAAYSRIDQDHHTAMMPDLTGLSLRAALDQLGNFAGSLDIRGSGRVIGQHPEPGGALSLVSSIRLTLATD